MKKKIVWIVAICSLLVTACGTTQTQTTTGGATLAELEKAKASLAQIPQETSKETPKEKPKEIPKKTPLPSSSTSSKVNSAAKPNSATKLTSPTKPTNPIINTTLPKNSSQSTNTDKSNTAANQMTLSPKNVSNHKPIPKPASPTKVNEKGGNLLSWIEFFDNELQNTPSQKFWDLQGKQVAIDGFMGEVLSFDGGWFLLIPAPGAECPFDNGDETYWNKIMIIFVKEKEGLRFTGGPLRITGRLDVGIKVDESNYKTMFRLYDATFEAIK